MSRSEAMRCCFWYLWDIANAFLCFSWYCSLHACRVDWTEKSCLGIDLCKWLYPRIKIHLEGYVLSQNAVNHTSQTAILLLCLGQLKSQYSRMASLCLSWACCGHHPKHWVVCPVHSVTQIHKSITCSSLIWEGEREGGREEEKERRGDKRRRDKSKTPRLERMQSKLAEWTILRR